MSQPLGQGSYCDTGTQVPTVSDLVASVGGSPGDPRAAVLVRVVHIGTARWNTTNGRRPTQAQADQMIDRLDLKPSIFTPLALRILHVYSGVPTSGQLTAFAETGRIGKDEDFSCAFGRAGTLQIREGPAVVAVGGTYVALLGKELVTGVNSGPLGSPVVQDLFVVRGSVVVGPAGSDEPLPSDVHVATES